MNTNTENKDDRDTHHVLGDLSQIETDEHQIDSVVIYTEQGQQFVFANRLKDEETVATQGLVFGEVHKHGRN